MKNWLKKILQSDAAFFFKKVVHDLVQNDRGVFINLTNINCSIFHDWQGSKQATELCSFIANDVIMNYLRILTGKKHPQIKL